jgi:2-dehydro-3-deoxyphosphooctonate aldolase (KDO 8-P synthase)
VQLPGGRGDSSGGQREFIPVLARAAVASGVNCLFMESHPDPKSAKSDADVVIDFKELPGLVALLKKLYEVVQG